MVATVERVFIDPYEAEKKILWRFTLYWALSLLLCLGLVAGVVMVIMDAGKMSMQAFEELPRYRVNRLLVDYREQVKSFEDSFAATEGMLAGEAANNLLQDGRALAGFVLAGEQDLAANITLYTEITDVLVQKTSGALEWNRHFQAQLQTLLLQSQQRQEVLAAIVDTLPAPKEPEVETVEPAPTVSKSKTP